MTRRKIGLDDAYAVRTPDDNRGLYRDWATTYETDFADAHGYVYHERVVDRFVTFAAPIPLPLDAPLLDVGCGTGVVGKSLQERGFRTIDGIDISPEMLAEADKKQLYRHLVEVDVTEPLEFAEATYRGVLSAGTFTHGHLGPEPLHELIRIGAEGAPYAIGINADHYEADGFGPLLEQLTESGTIGDLELDRVAIYDATTGEHADTQAVVALFRRGSPG